jgi:hypothetical protein
LSVPSSLTAFGTRFKYFNDTVVIMTADIKNKTARGLETNIIGPKLGLENTVHDIWNSSD